MSDLSIFQPAVLCYLKRNKQTLMIYRNKKENDYHKGKWNGLGGKFEVGEFPEDCAKREVFEESGLKLNSLELKGIITFPKFDGIKDWIVFIFISEDFEGEIKDSPEGKIEWIDDDKLLDLNLWEGDIIFLPWLKQEKFFSAKFIYENKKLKNYEVFFY